MAMTGAGLAAARQAAMDAVTCTQTTVATNAQAYRIAVLLADSTAIVAYIVANSELVPVTWDSGDAGAGIITGTVK
jgi:hypothetical protein